MSAQGQGGYGGGFQAPSYGMGGGGMAPSYGGNYGSGPMGGMMQPQQQGGFMRQQWGPPQGASPMNPGYGGAPQWQQPPSFAQLFGGGNPYGAPYGTFPGGMGGSGGNMWPGPVNKGPIADPAPAYGGPAVGPGVIRPPVDKTQPVNNYGNYAGPYMMQNGGGYGALLNGLMTGTATGKAL